MKKIFLLLPTPLVCLVFFAGLPLVASAQSAGSCPAQSNLTLSGPIVLSNKSNVVISGKKVSNLNGNCITINGGSNITIKDSQIGPCKGEGIQVNSARNVEVANTHFENVRAGVYVRQSSGINVHNNTFLNMRGPFPRGAIVQYNGVTGGGNRVNDNIAINEPNKGPGYLSYPDTSVTHGDTLNMYASRGTAGDPIQIIGNKIKGNVQAGGFTGGIVVGDGTPNITGRYILIRDNILVNPSGHGIAIAGGDHIQVLNNTIYGQKYDYGRHPRDPSRNIAPFASYTGIQVNNYFRTSCHSHTVQGNKVNWTSAFYRKGDQRNAFLDTKTCGPVAGVANNDWNANINTSIWQQAWTDMVNAKRGGPARSTPPPLEVEAPSLPPRLHPPCPATSA